MYPTLSPAAETTTAGTGGRRLLSSPCVLPSVGLLLCCFWSRAGTERRLVGTLAYVTLAGTAARRVLQGPVTGSTNQRRPGAQAGAPTVSRFHFTHTAGRLSVCLSHAALCEPFVSHPPVPFFLCYPSSGSLFPATGLVFDTWCSTEPRFKLTGAPNQLALLQFSTLRNY